MFTVDRNRELVEKLRDAGVEPHGPGDGRGVRPRRRRSTGRTFVLTGGSRMHPGRGGQAEIEARGGKITGSVSKKTSYVVVGESPGSKLAKAEQLGVTILDEDAFATLLEQGPAPAESTAGRRRRGARQATDDTRDDMATTR